MLNDRRPEIGSTVALPKAALDSLLARLQEQGYEPIGPHVQDGTLLYAPIQTLKDLPQGFVSEQEAGHFRIVYTGHTRYFDIIPGAHSWKQFLFPSRMELLSLRQGDSGWSTISNDVAQPHYAFIGVRACEMAAIQIQDGIFIRPDFTDPVYRARREHVFILAVNCLHPAGTCFCASMDTGPRVKDGFDLSLTELEDVFLLAIGSETGRDALAGLPFEAASAFLLNAAGRRLERAAQQMGRSLDTSDLPGLILENLDNPHWREIATRCLSCANCTQVCPTCFCWDTLDTLSLDGKETTRERVWDSCFNPGYSYQAGGNTRPTIQSRYRQWMSHKLGTWKEQFGTLGCVGCGRCITWCPAAIDITAEVASLRKEARR
jgi:sulfhydrogenase subunit beta (sulfur reductase)